jgi:hypothetical protein
VTKTVNRVGQGIRCRAICPSCRKRCIWKKKHDPKAEFGSHVCMCGLVWRVAK